MIRLGATPIVDDAQPLSAILSARVRRWKRERSRKEINRPAGARDALFSPALNAPTRSSSVVNNGKAPHCASCAILRAGSSRAEILIRVNAEQLDICFAPTIDSVETACKLPVAAWFPTFPICEWYFGKKVAWQGRAVVSKRGAISFLLPRGSLIAASRCQFNGAAGRSLLRAALYARSASAAESTRVRDDDADRGWPAANGSSRGFSLFDPSLSVTVSPFLPSSLSLSRLLARLFIHRRRFFAIPHSIPRTYETLSLLLAQLP